MIKTESFPALFLVIYCPAAIIAVTLLFLFGNAELLKSAVWGSVVSVLLIWISVFAADILPKSSVTGLLILVFGGIVFRFAVVVGTGLWVNFLTNMNITFYFSGLLFSYLIMHIIESIYFHKQFGNRNPDNK